MSESVRPRERRGRPISRSEGRPLPPSVLVGGALLVAAAAGVVSVEHADGIDTAYALGMATAAAAVVVTVGLAWSRQVLGRVDLFFPLVFPVLYVAVAFLAPLWVVTVTGERLGPLTPSIADERTGGLMILGLTGFVAGCLFGRPGVRRAGSPLAVDVGVLRIAGRGLLLLAGVLGVLAWAGGAVRTRGLDQVAYGTDDVLRVTLDLASLTGVLLVLAASAYRSRALLAPVDIVLVLVVLVAQGASGRRGASVAVLLCILLVFASRRGRSVRAALGLVAVAAFAVVVLTYRNAATGKPAPTSAVRAVLSDLAAITYTTGATASLVPDVAPHAQGSTMVAAVLRLLPSPIINPLIGPATDTGSRRFRSLASISNPDLGVGYSITADGYLNFGAAGLLMLCVALGFALSWAYARFDLLNGRATGLLYAILLASLPILVRSDTLGFLKRWIYPAAIVWGVLVVSRSYARRRR